MHWHFSFGKCLFTFLYFLLSFSRYHFLFCSSICFGITEEEKLIGARAVCNHLVYEFNHIKDVIESHTVEMDHELASALEALNSVLDVEQLICKNLTHYHQMHHHLAIVTTWFYHHSEFKSIWKMFLQALHDRRVILIEQEESLFFDSGIQLELLEDKTLTQFSNGLMIELLQVEEVSSFEEDFQSLVDIFKEGFSMKEWFGDETELGILFLRDQLVSGDSLVFIMRHAEQPRKIVGMIWARSCSNEEEHCYLWQIYNVCRRAAYIKLNIGRRLLHFMQTYTGMTSMFLHVDPSNLSACNLYKNAGFVQSVKQIGSRWPAPQHFISMLWCK